MVAVVVVGRRADRNDVAKVCATKYVWVNLIAGKSDWQKIILGISKNNHVEIDVCAKDQASAWLDTT